ncbi:hypothetical protein LUZ61_015465 [Rhynchospora tenuis]|uniref:Ubiquitin-like protease family profile domain-containing protein n=1 Tax=Rhynchospora tenuis TaxID=198213 RepID=A0AAD5Z3N7_9POAL|nr:hypothetical protein LUZ61_015465 [Rhynchospora tenuis]
MEHQLKFVEWLEENVASQLKEGIEVDETVKWLSRGSDSVVDTFQGYHWTVIIIDVKKENIYFIDSLSREDCIQRLAPKPFITTAYKNYKMEKEKKSVRKTRIFDWFELPAPKQKGSTECGYFTMLAMRAIINHVIQTGELPKKIDPVGKPYKKEDITDIVNEVMAFMYANYVVKLKRPSLLTFQSVLPQAKSRLVFLAGRNVRPSATRIEELGDAAVYAGAKFRAPVEPY